MRLAILRGTKKRKSALIIQLAHASVSQAFAWSEIVALYARFNRADVQFSKDDAFPAKDLLLI